MKIKPVAWIAIAVVAFLVYGELGSQAFGDSIGSGNVKVTIYDSKGVTSSKDWTTKLYSECNADMPGYHEYTQGVRTYSNGTPWTSPQTTTANSYSFSQTVYGVSTGSGQTSPNKPQQHPECVELYVGLAKKLGINTTIIYTNTTTIVKDGVKMWVCADNTEQTTQEGCIGHSPVVTVISTEKIYVCSDGSTNNESIAACGTSGGVVIGGESKDTNYSLLFGVAVLGAIILWGMKRR